MENLEGQKLLLDGLDSIRVYISKELKERMKQHEKNNGVKFQQKIRNFIKKELEENEKSGSEK